MTGASDSELLPCPVSGDTLSERLVTRYFPAVGVRTYPTLWAAGFLIAVTRWATLFLCSYAIEDQTHNVFLVQVGGALFFAPMLIGGGFIGALSDRVDRRIVCGTVFGVLAAVVSVFSLVAGLDRLPAWAYLILAGAVGWVTVTNTTVRLALVYEVVGADIASGAMALENIGMGLGALLGPLAAGLIIQTWAISVATWLPAACLLLSAAMMAKVERPVRSQGPRLQAPLPTERTSEGSDKPSGRWWQKSRLQEVLGTPGLLPILGITIVMNLFYFSYVPMVPVVAAGLKVDAALTGLLASAASYGTIAAALGLALRQPTRKGLSYSVGSVLALGCLAVVGITHSFSLDMVLLLVAGLGQGAFGTMQGLLVLRLAREESRGSAMGLLSMSIGLMPLGLVGVGGLADLVGTRALFIAGLIGLVGVGSLTAASRSLRLAA